MSSTDHAALACPTSSIKQAPPVGHNAELLVTISTGAMPRPVGAPPRCLYWRARGHSRGRSRCLRISSMTASGCWRNTMRRLAAAAVQPYLG